MSKSTLHVILLIALIFPIGVFIGINDYHDWGGDFAQYLSQTKDFLSGTSDTKLAILNYEVFCPKQRGSGFSFLLSPVYYLTGHNIKSLLTLISIFYVLLGVVLYYFFQTRYSQVNNKIVSILLVLNILYNYHVLKLKMEIMPIFPFMLILYSILIVYSFHKKTYLSFFFISILIGLLITVRNIGLCIYIAILLHLFIEIVKNYDSKKLNELLIIFFIPLLTIASIKWLVFGDISLQNITWYNSVFSLGNIKDIIFNNLQSYLNTIKRLFEQEIWGWSNILIRDSVLILFLIGLVKKWREKIDVTDTFFIIYIGLLLIYPYDKATYRFLIPVLPIILIYIIIGIKSIELRIKNHYLVFSFFLILLVSNYINVKNIIIDGDKYILGPENEKASEAFQFIKNTIHDDYSIAFSKPSVLHYYTSKKSLYINSRDEVKKIENELIKYKTPYILLCSDSIQSNIFNIKMLNHTNNNYNYKKVWANEEYILYKYKNSSNNSS